MPALRDARHEAMAHGLAAGKKQLQAYKDAGFTGNTTASSTKIANRPDVVARVQEIIATQHRKEIRSNERAIVAFCRVLHSLGIAPLIVARTDQDVIFRTR